MCGSETSLTRGHSLLREGVHIDALLEVLSELQTCALWVEQICQHLLIDLQTAHAAQEASLTPLRLQTTSSPASKLPSIKFCPFNEPSSSSRLGKPSDVQLLDVKYQKGSLKHLFLTLLDSPCPFPAAGCAQRGYGTCEESSPPAIQTADHFLCIKSGHGVCILLTKSQDRVQSDVVLTCSGMA